MIARVLSLAYWPNPSLNESAYLEKGNAVVDKLTIGELVQFYSEVQSGPTYCMVTARVQELLKKIPTNVDNRKNKAIEALNEVSNALRKLITSTEVYQIL